MCVCVCVCVLCVCVCVCVFVCVLQVGPFSRLLQENGRPAIQRVHVSQDTLSGLLVRYKTALQRLKDDIEGLHT